MGRPPLWAETQTEVMRRIVRFTGLDAAAYPEAVPEEARALIGALLHPEPAQRLGAAPMGGMGGVSAHPARL